MKSHKSTGPDGIPAEVWQHSELALTELFFFIKNVWDRECVSKSFVLCMFVMIHKKESSEDCSKYRAIRVTEPLLQNYDHLPLEP